MSFGENQALKDDIKASFGRTATYVWLGGGTVLMIIDGGWGRFGGPLGAAAFLLVGMFVSAIVVGGLSWWAHKKMAAHLMKFVDFDNPETIARAQRYRGLGSKICLGLSWFFLLAAFYSIKV